MYLKKIKTHTTVLYSKKCLLVFSIHPFGNVLRKPERSSKKGVRDSILPMFLKTLKQESGWDMFYNIYSMYHWYYRSFLCFHLLANLWNIIASDMFKRLRYGSMYNCTCCKGFITLHVWALMTASPLSPSPSWSFRNSSVKHLSRQVGHTAKSTNCAILVIGTVTKTVLFSKYTFGAFLRKKRLTCPAT